MTYDHDMPTVDQLGGGTSEEWTTYRSSPSDHGRTTYALSDHPEHCEHGVRCQRCAILGGEWVDFS